MEQISRSEWIAKGTALFGPDMLSWRFRCPCCGHVQTPEDFRPFEERGATPNSAVNECLGRYLPKEQRGGLSPDHANTKVKSPCDYAAYGLFRLAPFVVQFEDGTESHAFGFAERQEGHDEGK